ncbi:hypothetical protein NDU88_012476 [Pleurodeles waltl]|uniref:Glycosyltransferase family 92 protein n=2 Tax=Pleurodeles waltl TaxID=8319 RepID=A0AAV7R071_PLEWA|nr:hypothetical protein NDU88_012476 [Pleurodeles waltl]
MPYGYLRKKVVPAKPHRLIQQQDSACENNVAEATITPVDSTNTYVIAAYLDFRGGRSVRLLGITQRSESNELFCLFCYVNSTYRVHAEMQVHADHFNFPYGTTDLLCDLQDDFIPPLVAVSSESDSREVPSVVPYLKINNIQEQLANAPPTDFDHEFVVCISTMFGEYNNVLQFVQAMEMYRILGAQKVVLYKTHCSRLLKSVIDYYEKMEFVDVVPWPITLYLNVSSGWHFPEHPGELHYYGQTATLNDCIYRYMYKSRYILLNDVDEIILPVNHKNWHDLMDYLTKDNRISSTFIFQNHVFPSTKEYEIRSVPYNDWNHVPGVDMLRYIYREPNIPNASNPTKMIINPRSVVKTSVHTPLEFSGEQYWVSSEDAKVCHYREPKQSELEKESLIEDSILLKYESALIKNVNNVLREIHLLDPL